MEERRRGTQSRNKQQVGPTKGSLRKGGNRIYLLQVHKGARHLLNASLLEVLHQICQAVKRFSTSNCVASTLNIPEKVHCPPLSFKGSCFLSLKAPSTLCIVPRESNRRTCDSQVGNILQTKCGGLADAPPPPPRAFNSFDELVIRLW